MDGLTSSDVALLANRDGDWMGGAGMFWIFALLVLAGGNGFGGFGGRGDYVTQADLSAGLAAQTTQNQLQSLAVETANNNYETAQLINAQTNQMLQQNNANLINAIQGFNALGLQIQSLSSHMDECCCSIKMQMLQDKLDDTKAQLVAAQNAISNYNQSQYLLGQLGRFVAWTPSGTQVASGT